MRTCVCKTTLLDSVGSYIIILIAHKSISFILTGALVNEMIQLMRYESVLMK